MPRFVLLQHDSPRGLHFDLMLEAGESLNTWALPQLPQPGVEIPCEALADHRLAYLDYEGPIAGDRGSVARYDHGVYTVQRQNDALWIVDLLGENLSGRATLRRISAESGHWRMSWVSPPPP
jgi:hypothetical protein